MSTELVLIFLNFFILIIYVKLYFFIYTEKVIFKNFLSKYVFFFLIYFFLIFKFLIKDFSDFFWSLILSNIFLFLILYFSITLKSLRSPTHYIFNALKKKSNYNLVLKEINKYKLINTRLKDLKKQGIIERNKNYYSLTPLGKKFIKFFSIIKNYFYLSNKG
jgi:predicted transcriptional regulator